RHVPQRMAPVRAKALNIAEGYRSWLLTERCPTQVSMNSRTNRCEFTPCDDHAGSFSILVIRLELILFTE
ncbi:MAG: hypothetical protein AB2809_19720, partial [Candidatus Thiodiazotropha sp.]